MNRNGAKPADACADLILSMDSAPDRYADSYAMNLSPSPVTQPYRPVQDSGHGSPAANRLVLTLNVVASASTFSDAIRTLDQKIALLADELEKAGIRRTDLETAHYELREMRNLRGARNVRTGFDLSRRIRLELPVDHALLDRFIAAVAASSAQPALSLGFTGEDNGTPGRGMPAREIADALRQAESMVRAAGLSLE